MHAEMTARDDTHTTMFPLFSIVAFVASLALAAQSQLHKRAVLTRDSIGFPTSSLCDPAQTYSDSDPVVMVSSIDHPDACGKTVTFTVGSKTASGLVVATLAVAGDGPYLADALFAQLTTEEQYAEGMIDGDYTIG